MGEVIEGRAIAKVVEQRVSARVEELDEAPVLNIITVGMEEGTDIYLRQITASAKRVGAAVDRTNLDLSSDVYTEALKASEQATGILIGHPLPDELEFSKFLDVIAPERDVEGLHPVNLGLLMNGEPRSIPPTPASVMEILASIDATLKGSECVIVNHSPILGRPLSVLMMRQDATVRVCNVFTSDLGAHTKEADVLVVGAGVPGLVTGDMVKEGSIVIDAGMNRVDGKVCGDVVTSEVLETASKATPVPGGVGPVTVSMLMDNLSRLALDQSKRSA